MVKRSPSSSRIIRNAQRAARIAPSSEAMEANEAMFLDDSLGASEYSEDSSIVPADYLEDDLFALRTTPGFLITVSSNEKHQRGKYDQYEMLTLLTDIANGEERHLPDLNDVKAGELKGRYDYKTDSIRSLLAEYQGVSGRTDNGHILTALLRNKDIRQCASNALDAYKDLGTWYLEKKRENGL